METRERVWVFHAGPFMISTTAQQQTCGSTEHTVATSTIMENRPSRCPATHKETTSPVCWTWRRGLCPLARMERCSAAQLSRQFMSLMSIAEMCNAHYHTLFYRIYVLNYGALNGRNPNWPLKMSMLQSSTLVSCSTAATQGRR